MTDLRVTIKRDAKRALATGWGRAISILLIFMGLHFLFLSLESGAQMLMNFDGYSYPHTWEDMLQQVNETPWVLMATTALLLFIRWFLLTPLSLGAKSWYLSLTDGQPLPVGELFVPLGNKLLGRSLLAWLLLALRWVFWGVLFTVVPAGVLGYSGSLLLAGQDTSAAIMGLVLGSGLTSLSSLLFTVFMGRYFLVGYLLTTRYDMKAGEAIRLSVRYTKGKLWELFILKLSFLPWLLLCLLVLPVFFVQPYMQTTFAIYARYFIESGKRGEAPFTREFGAAQ